MVSIYLKVLLNTIELQYKSDIDKLKKYVIQRKHVLVLFIFKCCKKLRITTTRLIKTVKFYLSQFKLFNFKF